MRKILLLLFLFSYSESISQSSDSFYPIQIGNKYVYEHWDQYLSCFPLSFLNYVVVTVSSDTVFQNGKKYYKFDGYWDGRYIYQRVDSISQNVYYYDLDSLKEVMLDSLLAQKDDYFNGNRNIAAHSVRPYVYNHDTNIYMGQEREWKGIFADGLIVASYQLFKGIGLTHMSYCHHNDGVRWVLKGALVNGQLIGDTTLTHINTLSSQIPSRYKLYGNYPNPFNPVTNIKFDIQYSGTVRIKVYDGIGREIATILDRNLAPGSYETQWNSGNNSSGIYFYRLETDNFSETRKMLLVK